MFRILVCLVAALPLILAASVAVSQDTEVETRLHLIDQIVRAEPAAETARGVVYADVDANGVRDAGERGIADVSVSNGREVVRTDDRGAWQLDVRDGDVLFVTKPAGFRFVTDARGLPQFHYVHRPEGTPAALELRYLGIEPTGALPASIDFGLIPWKDEPTQYDVILFADTQPQSHVELDYVRDDVVAELLDTDALFGMTLGDIMYDDMSLFPRYFEIVGELGVPWHNVPGNHELNFLAPNDALSLETFKRYLGLPSYSFTVGRAHFVVLDDVIYDGTSRGRTDANVRGSNGYTGGFTEAQLDWLEADLAHVPEDQLIVLTMHIPLRSHLDPEGRGLNVLDRARFFSILSRFDHTIAFAGHTHVLEHHYFGSDDGWNGEGEFHQHVLHTVCGSWWTGPRDARGIPITLQRDGVPNGHTILSIDGNRAVAQFRGAGLPDTAQMRIGFDRAFHQLGGSLLDDYRDGELQAGPLLVDELPSTEVYVNLFNGGPKSRVEMRVDHGEWITMRREFRKDPAMIEHMTRHADTMKGWVKPVDTNHIFFAKLPRRGLGPGVHRIDVRARDEYGVEHSGVRLFEIRR